MCAVSRGTSQQGFVECPNGPKLQRGSSPGSKTPEAWKVLGNLSVVASNFGEDDILERMRCRVRGGGERDEVWVVGGLKSVVQSSPRPKCLEASGFLNFSHRRRFGASTLFIRVRGTRWGRSIYPTWTTNLGRSEWHLLFFLQFPYTLWV